ncbi:DNA polymerase iota-like protein [Podospora appendiculata]|uniref:DNA polymerase iota-like protein n=1 Tax=Podospora appendiculata TaxID=314037 RepID=A0AAE0X2Z2_9PEZI|nr:DNA polymerase iota-like protein [Podospora appendiculata]
MSRPPQPIHNPGQQLIPRGVQCIENQQPALKALPLGIRQKSILATCNYEARRRGIKKLMLVSDAKKACPELVVVDGEDLTPFRDASKRLSALLRAASWNGKVERLGLDEIFLDVTDMVAYNTELLNRDTLAQSFFCLSRDDPEKGFAYDASVVSGCCVRGDTQLALEQENPFLYTRLLLASHLASRLRLQMEEHEGFTSSCGIATNKLLAKLAGAVHKPRNQTTLLTTDITSFMDPHPLRAVPGIGAKTTHLLESFLTTTTTTTSTTPPAKPPSLTVGAVRTHPRITPSSLATLLPIPSTLAHTIWALLHGVDDTPVQPARTIPTQISIEDTYSSSKPLLTTPDLHRELHKLTASLLRRMHTDLAGDPPPPPAKPRWLAYPRTLRLTTRPRQEPGKPYNHRASRSAPLPRFVFEATTSRDQRAQRLVNEIVLPLLYKLNSAPLTSPGGARVWNIGLINVCVTNMADGFGGGDGSSTGSSSNGGRDIATMFQRQEDVLREFTAYDDEDDINDQDIHTHTHTKEIPHDDETTMKMTTDITNHPTSEENHQSTAHSPRQEKPATTTTTTTTITHNKPPSNSTSSPFPAPSTTDDDNEWDDDDEYDDDQDASRDGVMELCPLCGHLLPRFALAAHDRFHAANVDDV